MELQLSSHGQLSVCNKNMFLGNKRPAKLLDPEHFHRLDCMKNIGKVRLLLDSPKKGLGVTFVT